MAQFFLYALTSSNINRFSKYFAVRIRRKRVIILSLKIPPHLKYVATLPCEMSGVCSSVSLIVPLVSAVAGLSASSSSNADINGTFDIKTAGCDSYFRQ